MEFANRFSCLKRHAGTKERLFSVTEWEVAHDGKNDNPHILPIDTLWAVNKRGEFFLFTTIYIL